MVLSIQTLCCDTHIFNSVKHLWHLLTQSISSDHPWDGSTPSFESSCVWLYWLDLIRKATPVYIRPYSSQCMSEQMRIMRSKELPEELRDRIVARHRSGQGYKKICAALKVPKSTVASIILKWKTFGTTRTLPRAGRPAKLSYRGRRALVREVKKNPKITVAELQRCIREMGESCRKSTITAALHQSGFMAEWPDGSLSSVQDTWKPAWSLLKNTWRTPRWWQIRFSGLMRPS